MNSWSWARTLGTGRPLALKCSEMAQNALFSSMDVPTAPIRVLPLLSLILKYLLLLPEDGSSITCAAFWPVYSKYSFSISLMSKIQFDYKCNKILFDFPTPRNNFVILTTSPHTPDISRTPLSSPESFFCAWLVTPFKSFNCHT